MAITVARSASFCYTHAQVINNDCQRAYARSQSNSTINRQYTNIMPVDVFRRAFLNLKSYCCKANIIGNQNQSCTEEPLADSYGYSPFLFDHLVDMILRRLDGDEKKTYGLTPDPIGKQRRDWINEVADSQDGMMPLAIEQKFSEQRKILPSVRDFSRDEAKNCTSNPEDTLWQEFNKNYPNTPLIHRYKNACQIAACAYNQATLGREREYTLKEGYDRCIQRIEQRIGDEYLYTKTTAMEKGNQLMLDNMKSYMLDYFSRDRMTQLQDLWFQTTDAFGTVDKNITEGTRICSG